MRRSPPVLLLGLLLLFRSVSGEEFNYAASTSVDSEGSVEFELTTPAFSGTAKGTTVIDLVAFGDAVKARFNFGGVRDSTLGISTDGVIGFAPPSSSSVLGDVFASLKGDAGLDTEDARFAASAEVGLRLGAGELYLGSPLPSNLTLRDNIPDSSGNSIVWALPLHGIRFGESLVFQAPSSTATIRASLSTTFPCLSFPTEWYNRIVFLANQGSAGALVLQFGPTGETSVTVPITSFQRAGRFCISESANNEVQLGAAFVEAAYIHLSMASGQPQIGVLDGTTLQNRRRSEDLTIVQVGDTRATHLQARDLVASGSDGPSTDGQPSARFFVLVEIGTPEQTLKVMVDLESSGLVVNTVAVAFDKDQLNVAGIVGGIIAGFMFLFAIVAFVIYRRSLLT